MTVSRLVVTTCKTQWRSIPTTTRQIISRSYPLSASIPYSMFTTTATTTTVTTNTTHTNTDTNTVTRSLPNTNIPIPHILYEGPFSSLTLRLKRVSITTAFISLVGVPLAILYKTYGASFFSDNHSILLDTVLSVAKDASVSTSIDVDSSMDVSSHSNSHSQSSPTQGLFTKQFIVGATAILAATGSTFALSFCFSPYVHTLEYLPSHIPTTSSSPSSSSSSSSSSLSSPSILLPSTLMIKATTRNILAQEVQTIFNLYQDVIPIVSPSNAHSSQPLEDVHSSTDTNPTTRMNTEEKKNTTKDNVLLRPFCNFIAKGIPMYVHPELIHDPILRQYLLGEKEWNWEMRESTKSSHHPTQ